MRLRLGPPRWWSGWWVTSRLGESRLAGVRWRRPPRGRGFGLPRPPRRHPMAARVVTVNDSLDGHVALDLECFDRIYLNGWVHNLQVFGQVVNFLTHHARLPLPLPGPAAQR